MLSAALRASVMDNYVPNEGRRGTEGKGRREGGKGKGKKAIPRIQRRRATRGTEFINGRVMRMRLLRSIAFWTDVDSAEARLKSATEPNLCFTHFFGAHSSSRVRLSKAPIIEKR